MINDDHIVNKARTFVTGLVVLFIVSMLTIFFSFPDWYEILEEILSPWTTIVCIIPISFYVGLTMKVRKL